MKVIANFMILLLFQSGSVATGSSSEFEGLLSATRFFLCLVPHHMSVPKQLFIKSAGTYFSLPFY